jgi:hypothetical protein
LAIELGLIERDRLDSLLKNIDNEEARALRLFAAGKISDAVWDGLWAEWQDRRSYLRRLSSELAVNQSVHVENLEQALEIFARIGTLYTELQRSDQKVLLRHIVHRVVVNDAGMVTLDLKTPFAYLNDLAEEKCARNTKNFELESDEKSGRSKHSDCHCSNEVRLS